MTVLPAPHSHCHACGSPYGSCPLVPAPRQCRVCSTVRWFNPTPISVLLQPVYSGVPARHDCRWGLLIAQRGIQPKRGQWGLVGGFVEWGDPSYEAGAVREFGEELEFEAGYSHDPGHPSLWYSAPGDAGQMIAFSVAANAMAASLLQHHVPNEETLAVRIMSQPEQLCFSSHTEAARRWFSLAQRAEAVQG